MVDPTNPRRTLGVVMHGSDSDLHRMADWIRQTAPDLAIDGIWIQYADGPLQLIEGRNEGSDRRAVPVGG